MYEYKVLSLTVKESERTLNEYAKDGWRLAAVSPNLALGMGIIVTLEKKQDA